MNIGCFILFFKIFDFSLIHCIYIKVTNWVVRGLLKYSENFEIQSTNGMEKSRFTKDGIVNVNKGWDIM